MTIYRRFSNSFDPLGMVGQDARVQHIGVAYHHMPGLANGAARRAGGIAIIGIGFDIRAQQLDQLVQFAHLISRQRLGRKQIQRPGRLDP